MEPPPFRVLSGLEHTSHGALALALSAEFGAVEMADVEGALTGLAERLAPAADREPTAQLACVGSLLAGHLVSTHTRSSTSLDDLRFDRVAINGTGHPIVCALVAVEAARIAGIDLGLVASRAAGYVGSPAAGAPMLLAPGGGWHTVDARALGDPNLAWHCPHEAAGIVLGMLLARAKRTGLVGVQVRAAELCLELPVDEDEKHRLHLQLAKVRARLN